MSFFSPSVAFVNLNLRFMPSSFFHRSLLLCLLLWMLPTATAEWRQSPPPTAQQIERPIQPQKTKRSKQKPRRAQDFGFTLLALGLIIWFIAIPFGLIAALVFSGSGLVLWAGLALGCAAYTMFYPAGLVLGSLGTSGMGGAIGVALGLIGMVISAIFNGLPLFIIALAVVLPWLTIATASVLTAAALFILILILADV